MCRFVIRLFNKGTSKARIKTLTDEYIHNDTILNLRFFELLG